MSANDLVQLFGVRKPVIAMAHIPALPGTPAYDESCGIDGLIEAVAADLKILLAAGVDAVLFSNEADRPYALQADFEAVAAMTRVITELAPRDRPFGVDFMWDPKAPIAIALATGATFVREVFTGVYESDMGLWNTDAAAVLRYRKNIGAQNIRLFYNIMPEFASYLGSRSLAQRARSAAVSSLPDALLVSGLTAGSEPGLGPMIEAKEAVGDAVPVLLNTGSNAANVRRYLEVADGVIVGSALKVDGYTWNPVDEDRVEAFMAAARDARGQ
jgi:membrane complex biogenesis BtpA family protein